jgi:hypothetical protein
MATRGPAPVDTGATPVVTRPVDRAPAPVPPGPGSTGQIPTVKKPAGPPEAAAPAVTPNAGITVPPVSTPQGPPETVPPAVTPGPATGQSTSANVTPTVPVQELPVDTPNVDAGNNVIPNINYIQVLANGTVVVSKTTALNFAGSGVTVTGSNGAATITISGSSYGNSNVVTLLSAFGSNTVSTTGNVTGGYLFGNGSQLTGLPSIYGNANVVANLAALGSNPVSTTGNVTGGNLLTGAQVVASGVIQTGTGFSTGGYLSVDGDTDLHKTTVTGNLSATGNVTGGNVLTGGIISATGNIFGGNAVFTGNLSVAGNVTYINSNVVTINDLAINLANNAANISLINGGGIELGPQGTPYVTFLYNTSANTFTSNVGLSAVANITGGNLLTGGLISATSTITSAANITGGNVLTAGLISASGNVTGSYILGNGSQLTGIAASYGNANVAANLAAFGSNPISTTGNVTAGNLIGNISITGNVTGTSANVSLVAGSYTTTFDNTGNTAFANGTVSVTTLTATGNITGNYILGNGSQLTGIAATYGNANVVANLAALGSNPVSTTGNVSAGYLFGNGSQLTGIAASGNTGNVTFSDQVVMGTGSTDGSGGLYLAPGNNSIANSAVQYLRVRGGDVVTHIHLDTGNNQYYDQYFGDDGKYVKLANTGNVVIGSDDAVGNSAQWTFGTSGNLTLPRGGVVYETNIPDGGLNGNTIALKPSGGTNADQQLLIYPTTNDANHLHLTTGNLYSTELFLGDDNLYVKLANTGNVVVNSNDAVGNTAQWTFDNFGTITLPGNMIISGNTSVFGTNASLLQTTDDRPLLALSSGANGAVSSLWVEDIGNVGTSNIAAVYANPTVGSKIVRIVVGQNGVGSGPNLWDFDTTGNLTVPGNIIMTTGIVGSGASPAPYLSGFSSLSAITVSASGNISATGNVTAANFFGNGNTLSNVATRFESSWTVPVGNSTQSFTVAASETYYLWVDCNIPNGILAWNATATVTNTNVPVVGAQYAWVYNGGGTPVDFTSIPNQFIGTANTIVRSNVAPSSTTNRFDFGINNTSGGNITVRYGWVAIS